MDLKHEIALFVAEHDADDVLYVLVNPKYFGHTPEMTLQLHSYLFRLINADKGVRAQ